MDSYALVYQPIPIYQSDMIAIYMGWRIGSMTAIERTAYPIFTRAPQPKELLTLYTPTPENVAFVATTARGPSQKFALMILLKVFQKLGYFTEFNRLREAPKSATFTHLDEWVERLTWLLSLGNMERLVEGLPATKVTHFAAEARSFHADELRDFTLPKRLTLLVCLIHRETISTRDEIVEMFLKRMSKFRERAKEELERLVHPPTPGDLRFFLCRRRTQNRGSLCARLRAICRLPRSALELGGM